MAMCEWAALAGEQAKERDAGALGGQGVTRHPRLPTVAKPVSRGRVVNRGQADFREGVRHESSLGAPAHRWIGLREVATLPSFTCPDRPESGAYAGAVDLGVVDYLEVIDWPTREG